MENIGVRTALYMRFIWHSIPLAAVLSPWCLRKPFEVDTQMNASTFPYSPYILYFFVPPETVSLFLTLNDRLSSVAASAGIPHTHTHSHTHTHRSSKAENPGWHHFVCACVCQCPWFKCISCMDVELRSPAPICVSTHKQIEDLKRWIEIRFLAGIWGRYWRMCACVSVHYVAKQSCLQVRTSTKSNTVACHFSKYIIKQTNDLNLNGNAVTLTFILNKNDELPLQVSEDNPAFYNWVILAINYDQHSVTV